ncbi:MAG: hypothetical protein J3Q66DRAFT_168740 [Benniella sp.]|nr:MAG: hypothetical protein J3Q66DRAFT_168740 [Benniella sp.]
MMLKEVPEPTLASTSDSFSQEPTEESTLQDSLLSLTSQDSSPSSSSRETFPASTPRDPSSTSTSKEPPFDATPEETPQDPVSSLTLENPSSNPTQQDLILPLVLIEAKELATDDIHQAAEQHSPSSASPGVPPVYNILLLGPPQSGKSTFLENAKQYANPEYAINTRRIGTGNESHTQTSCVEDIVTSLPIYKVYDEYGDELDTGSLKDERGFELRPVKVPGSPDVRFRIFDTPGLNDTNGNDIQNIASNFSALSEVDHLNLIIITYSHHVPFAPSAIKAIKAYFDLFSNLKGLVTILYTHSPNRCRVPKLNTIHDRRLKEMSKFFTIKRIDCDPSETGPANLCIRRNTIREILEMAKIRVPVTLNTMHVYKTPFMVHVDRSVRDAYRAKLNESLKKCKSITQKLSVEIEEAEEEIKNKNRDIDEHDTDEMLPLFEKRFDEEVGFFSWWADPAGQADKQHTMELPDQEYTIDEIKVAKKAIHILDETGGCGHKSWNVKFKRDQYSTGYYHAVLKMKKSTRYQKEIEGWRSEVECLKEELKLKKQGLATLESQEAIGASGNTSNEFVKLMNLIAKSRMIIGIAADETLPLELFMELAKARVYRQDDNGGSTREHHRILEQYAEVPQEPPKV